ncbi:multidrug effflux MFS transporter [Mobilicoccus caccae]|uniref:Bcr/CflA family drug resistance efflux transporter n=1 Tax=Mobilicoccus caccae TaxID=1859295 RepID=A0ABQ6IQT3_9MICO|nr:multidrug effflux MFS transporter [Mobilicoccus caccae]GMA40257.1 Bcr/CflA family drug resistance efflux transporter [Mobilicoccus caccae]
MTESNARPLPSRRRLLIMLGALSAFGPLSFDMYLPGLPQLTRDLGAGETGGQLSLSVSMIGMGIGQVVIGPLSDQLGRRRLLLMGVSLFTVAAVACALTPSLEFLLLARLLGGIGGGAGAVLARSMVRDLFSGREAARAFGITALVFGVAPVVAPLLGALLMAVTGWRGIFVALAVCGTALFVAAMRLPETLPPERRHDGGVTSLFSEFPRVLRDRSFLAPALVLAIGFQPLSLYLAMSSFALQQGYGLTPQQFGYLFAANSVGILLLGRINLRVVDTLGPYRVLTWTVGLSIVACLAVAVATNVGASVWWVLVPLFFAISIAGPLLPNATTLALEGQADAVGAAAACIGLVQTLFGALVPPAISLLGVTPQLMGTAMAITSVLCVVPLLAVPRRG